MTKHFAAYAVPAIFWLPAISRKFFWMPPPAKPVSRPFISIACSTRRSVRRRIISLLDAAWNTPATCLHPEK